MKSTLGRYLLWVAISMFIDSIATANTIPKSYIVEYAQQEDIQAIIHQDLAQYQDLYNIHHTYASPIFHGMSFSLKEAPQESTMQPVAYSSVSNHPVFHHLSNNPAIKNIYPIYEVPRPQWMPNSKSFDYTFPYSNSDAQIYDIHKELGVTGNDILIGVLDSGVDYTHPALGGGFGPGFKVKYGKNLVSSTNDKSNGIKSLGEDDPFDPCTHNDAGHGTHVSGIIAGYDKEKNFTGIAPNVTLGVWRIFGCEGGASEDTVIKAMEMAYEAGCKIINLSLGIENGWPENAMAAVAENLSKKGVIVVGVVGNQGTNGIYSQNAPATGRSVVSAASVDNSFYPTRVMDISIVEDEYFPYMLSSNTVSFPNGTLSSALVNNTFSYGCKNDTTFTIENAKDRILLMRRGVCTFDEKLVLAKELGATGVLFFDAEATTNNLVVAKTKNGTLPCAGVEKQVADKVLEHLQLFQNTSNNSGIQISFPAGKKIVFPDTAGRISDFSSTGPSYELDLKPTMAGIGGDVYSTLPLHVDEGWGVRSGTSMASPHIAGCAALLIDYYSKQNINVTLPFIIEHLQNHAKLINSKWGVPEHPLVQGAGLIQPYDTIKSLIHVSPSQISFNDTSSHTEYKSYTLQIQNLQSVPLSVSIENIQTNSIESYANATSFTITEPAITNGTIKVDLEFSSPSILLLPPFTTTLVQVEVVLPNPDELFYHFQMYGGFISIKNTETQQSLATVPYFGVLGSMMDIPVFDAGFPYLASINDTAYKPSRQISYRYDMSRKPKANKPAIVFRLLTGSANMEIKVYDENHGYLGIISGGPWNYHQRNSLGEENFHSSIAWSGRIIPLENEQDVYNYEDPIYGSSVQVEDGTYYLSLRALKHFGNPKNDSDWEEWKSGPIIVQS